MGRILDFRFWSWGGDLEVKGGGEELVLFEGVDGEGAGGGGGGRAAAGVADLLFEKGAEPGFQMVPGAHVAGFLLAPDDFGVGRMLEDGDLQFLFVEGDRSVPAG